MREKQGYREALEQVGEAFPGKKMLTIENVASFLNCNRKSVLALIESRKLNGIDIGMGAYKIYRISVKDLANFLAR